MADVGSQAFISVSSDPCRPEIDGLLMTKDFVSMYTLHCPTVHIHQRACHWEVYYSHIPGDQAHTYIKGWPLTICFCEGRCSDKAGQHSQGAARRRSHALLICGPHARECLGYVDFKCVREAWVFGYSCTATTATRYYNLNKNNNDRETLMLTCSP